MATVKVEWDMREVNAMLEKLKVAGQSGAKALVAGGEVAVAQAKINAENQGLHDTGNLIGSIGVYDITPNSVMVGSRGVIYNAVHEFGATILPKRAKVLHWVDKDGNDVFAMRSVIPARPYLRPAFDEHKDDIVNAIGKVVSGELK